MVVALDGFLDAGSSAAIAARHLTALGAGGAPGGSVVATFDVDQFHDYRARRPAVSFARDHYEAYDAPRLVVRLLRDSGGTPYLLLQRARARQPLGGLRPRGARGRRAVRRDPGRRDGLGADGGAAHPSDRDHPPRQQPRPRSPAVSPWSGDLRVPSSAQALLEIRLGEWGHDAQGFVAHIPHYLAQLEYPQASADPARAGRARRSPDPRPDRPHSRGRRARGRDHPLPRRQRGGRRGRRLPRAPVRRVRRSPRRAGPTCSPRTSRSRPATRSASSSSSSWPGSSTRDETRAVTPS